MTFPAQHRCQLGMAARKPAMQPAEFKSLRKSTGLSQQKFADLIGVHRMTVYAWERGEAPVPKYAVLIGQLLAAKRQALITGRAPTVDL